MYEERATMVRADKYSEYIYRCEDNDNVVPQTRFCSERFLFYVG